MESRLIEFPRRPRPESTGDAPTPPSVPAWRAEVTERVRAARAKRAAAAGESDPRTSTPGTPVGVATVAQEEAPPVAPVPEARKVNKPIDPQREVSFEAFRTNDNIVEAALTRVKRASEHAPRTTMGQVDAARPLPPNGFVVSDRHATARALEVQPEVAPAVRTPLPKTDETGLSEPQTRMLIIEDEIEPRDYLEAEIRKVDRVLAAQFAKNEGASLGAHFVIGLVDIIAIALSSAPFMVLIFNSTGFSSTRSRIVAGTIVGLVSFFYLTVTQALCAKTFGMMLTNTRVVNADTFRSVSPGRALARTIGYYIALAPAALGFLWTLGNRKHRGWHDFLSGTLVARDF